MIIKTHHHRTQQALYHQLFDEAIKHENDLFQGIWFIDWFGLQIGQGLLMLDRKLKERRL